MKLLALLATFVATLEVPIEARQMHAGINYQRYLSEYDETAAEAKEWTDKFEKTCIENNWMPDYSSEERSSVDRDEDIRQRIFMSKQDVLEAQADNPNANFSIMTPFSILTKEEFASKVLNSYVRGNSTKPPATPAPPKRALRQLQQHQQDQTYTFTSMQAMIDSLMKSLQQQMGGQWTIGTVKPATEHTTNTDTSTSKQWHWTIPATPQTAAPIAVTPASVPVPAPAPVSTPAPTPKPTPKRIPVTAAPKPVTAAPKPVVPKTYPPRTNAPRPVVRKTYPPRTNAPKPATPVPALEPITRQPAKPVQTQKGVLKTSNSVDWSASKCMSPVQSQGQCGSCWAFASIAAVESLQCIKNGQSGINKYSEQQLVGCDRKNMGCGGGAPVYAFEYIQQNGLCWENALPYTLKEGGSVSCSSCSRSQTGITGYEKVNEGDEAGLINALKSQPVVAAVASGNAAWKQYTGGVMSSCQTTQLDHAVLIVGYDDSTFKVRNSWGANWGEAGYVRIARNPGTGTCGLLTDMSRPKM